MAGEPGVGALGAWTRARVSGRMMGLLSLHAGHGSLYSITLWQPHWGQEYKPVLFMTHLKPCLRVSPPRLFPLISAQLSCAAGRTWVTPS